MIVPCPECGKKLGVPGDRGTLRVTCPACKHVFNFRSMKDDVPIPMDEYLRFAARVVIGTLFFSMRGEDGEGVIDPERIVPTAFLAGRKIFGDVYTRELVAEAVQWAREDFGNGLSRLATSDHFARFKARHSTEEKDKIILAALVALQLNIDEPAAEMLPLREFGVLFYDTPIMFDQRLLLEDGSGPRLFPRSIEISNELCHDLSALTSDTPEAPESTTKKKSTPARNFGKGLLILATCLIISLAGVRFTAINMDDPPGWLVALGVVSPIVFYYWVYRAFRMITGAGVWGSVALTVFGFPLLFGMALFGIGLVLSQYETCCAFVPDLVLGGEIGSQDIDNGKNFSGLNANNTSAAELDDLMEDW